MSNFDETAYYNDEVQPVMDNLLGLLKRHDIPFFFSACIAEKGGKSTYVSELVSPDITGRRLSDNRFPKYVDVNLGFNTIIPRPIEIEVEAREAGLENFN